MTWKIVGIGIVLIIVLSLVAGIRDLLRSGKTVDRRVLFSSVEGVLRSGQTPVAGATITREWHFAERAVKQKDEAVTDAEGRFSFPEVAIETQRGVLGQFLPQEFIVGQYMSVVQGETTIEVWYVSKRGSEAGGEFYTADFSPVSTPLNVVIDLKSQRAARTFSDHSGNIVLGHTIAVNDLEMVREEPLSSGQ